MIRKCNYTVINRLGNRGRVGWLCKSMKLLDSRTVPACWVNFINYSLLLVDGTKPMQCIGDLHSILIAQTSREVMPLHSIALWLAVAMLLGAAAAAWKLLVSVSPKLPSGPKGLPIIGILHVLARAHQRPGRRHRALAELASRYGDMMYVRLGSFPAVVASSMETARLFLKTHDTAFASRMPTATTEYVVYGGRDAAFAPYGEHWRQARKLCVLHLLSSQKIESFRPLREGESTGMVADLWLRSGTGAIAVDLSAAFRAMPFIIMWRTLAGDSFPELVKPLMQLVAHISEFISLPLLGDYVPWLRCLDFPSICRMKKVFFTFDAFAQSLLDRQSKECLNLDDTTFLGTLLQLPTRDPTVTPTVIKALILDMFVGGTETVASTMEWATTLLLKNPSCAERLRHELGQEVGRDRRVQESDISHMKYLHCVVKESMRLCSVTPLGISHFSTEEVTVRGFTLPKGTILILNYWAMNRDPAVWESPEEFKPERFMDDDVVDLSGLSDFKSLPFGAGRRVCPGIGMALSSVLLGLAKLFHTFEWVPHGDIDMEEGAGNIMSRKNPLLAVPKFRLNCNLLA